MRQGQGQRDSCKSACSKIIKKIRVGVNAMRVRTKRLGYRGESRQDDVQERQGSVLTNQCLGKERMLSEELKNPSTDQTYL